MGIISVGDKNFRGVGDNINVRWEFGGNAETAGNYNFSYTHPWLDNKQTSIGFNIYNLISQYTDYNTNGDSISTYDRRYYGGDITLGRPVNDNLTHLITFKNRNDVYSQYISGINYQTNDTPNPPYPAYAPNFIPENFGLTRSITLARVFDSRDSTANPSTGTRYLISDEVAGFGADFNFNKINGEFRRYWPVGKTQTLAFRMNAGYGTGHVPFAQFYSAGGIDTLRGYNDDQFKGNRMFTTSVEYRFPVVKRVSAVLFTDAGDAWSTDPTAFPQGLVSDFSFKVGYGVGIRVVTPFGPVRLDYGFGSQGGRLHFGFGGQF
jgi:outer membrane protein insertion porin family